MKLGGRGVGGRRATERMVPHAALVLVCVACRGTPGDDPAAPPGDRTARAYYAEESCCNPGDPTWWACQDGLWCNGVEWCNCWGECRPGDPIRCDQFPGGWCDEAQDRCRYPVGECTTDADCLDANPCTDDLCVATVCRNTLDLTNTCPNDENPCTRDDCATGACYSLQPVGTPCEDLDGLFCNGQNTCDPTGACIAGDPPCPLACQSCDEDLDACVITGCEIAGGCYAEDDVNPANTCEWCKPAVSQSAWTQKPAGAPCDDGLYCTATDTCDAAGACVSSGDTCALPPFSGCTTGCDETLDACIPIAAGTPCDDGLWCTLTDLCNAAGMCVGAGDRCPAAGCASGCDEATQTCIPFGGCRILGACYAPGATDPSNPCRHCDPALSPTSWSPKPAGTSCDDGQWCTLTDTCDAAGSCVGSGTRCPVTGCVAGCNEVLDACTPAPAGTVCAAAAGDCALEGVCDGVSTTCPAGGLRPATYVCRPALGECDVAENCTGSSATCPADVRRAAGYVCRASAGTCDVEETCDGVSTSCPADALRPNGFVCRASAGACDLTETCSGSSADCPADAFAPNTTLCRGAAGNCDAPEYCPGTGPLCPADACLPYGTLGVCPADAYACTNDICDGACACIYPIQSTSCLIGGVCYASGALNPVNPCQVCQPTTSQTAWTNVLNGTVCVTDADPCTNQTCQAGVCTVTSTNLPGNDLCPGNVAPGPLAQSGDGASMIWTGSGNTTCATDNYSSPCGGAGWPDTVHQFTIPQEFATYRYRVQVAGPAAFNPVQYYYYNQPSGCGVGSSYYSCNDNGSAACWAIAGALARDDDDSCQHELWFPSGPNYVVVDSVGAGGTYQVKVDRAFVNTGDCTGQPLPELQLGGTWYGNTCDSTTYWRTNMPYCVQTTDALRYRFNIYHVNHAVAPFNTLNRGYIVWLDGTLTSGGMDTTLFFTVNACRDPWYLLSCDNDSHHWRAGPAGRGSRLVTGRVPSGWWAGVIVSNYPDWACGNYTLRTDFDDDGDGVPDSSDGSNTLMRGAQPTAAGEDRALDVPAWPWADHGYSYGYPNDLRTAFAGREVYYRYVKPGTSSIRVRMYPRIRGDVYAGASSFLFNGVVWAYTPTSIRAYCRGSGWFWTTAGGWTACNLYGAGEWEQIFLENAPADAYYFAVDAVGLQGGWFTIEFLNP